MLHSILNPYSPSACPKTPMFNLLYKRTILEESHQNISSIAITSTEMNNVDLIPASDEQAMKSLSKLDIHFADSVNKSNSYNQTENLLRRPPTPPRKSSRKLKKKKQVNSKLELLLVPPSECPERLRGGLRSTNELDSKVNER